MAKDPIEVPDIHRYRERPLAETLDPATVRACIEILEKRGIYGVLESLLPKPAPEPEPVYLEHKHDSAGHLVAVGPVLTLADIQQRHGLLTPEQATKVAREHFKAPRVWTNHEDELLVALRRAAKGGECK